MRSKNNQFQKVFLENMGVIFQWASQDIRDSIESREMNTLLCLRTKLCSMIQTTFAEFADRQAINRKVKHKVLHDIYNLGYSQVNMAPVKELDKLFCPKNSSSTSTVTVDNTETESEVSQVS